MLIIVSIVDVNEVSFNSVFLTYHSFFDLIKIFPFTVAEGKCFHKKDVTDPNHLWAEHHRQKISSGKVLLFQKFKSTF